MIASSFFLLTRYEEVVSSDPTILDKHERFPATASMAYKEKFLHRPLVNEYFDLLWGWINEFCFGLTRSPLWNGNNFALCLTHDIDRVRTPWSELRTLGSFVLKQRKPYKAFVILWHNTFFDSDLFPGWPNTYEKVLEYSTQKGGSILNAKELLTCFCRNYRAN